MAKLTMPEMASRVIEGLGGAGNIAMLNHCATRLRINVNRPADVDVAALKKVPGVLGVELKGDYLQVIVGAIIEDLYLAVEKISGGGGWWVCAA